MLRSSGTKRIDGRLTASQIVCRGASAIFASEDGAGRRIVRMVDREVVRHGPAAYTRCGRRGNANVVLVVVALSAH
jgi:hypothetical protein